MEEAVIQFQDEVVAGEANDIAAEYDFTDSEDGDEEDGNGLGRQGIMSDVVPVYDFSDEEI